MAYRKKPVKPLQLQIMVVPDGTCLRWEWRTKDNLQQCTVVELKQNENLYCPIKF